MRPLRSFQQVLAERKTSATRRETPTPERKPARETRGVDEQTTQPLSRVA